MSAKKLKVVVTRKLPAPVELRLKELFDARLNDDDHPFTQDELAEAMQTADVLVPTVTDKLDGRIMARAGDQLRLIAQFGAGVDNIDVDAATERGIFVVNTPQAPAEAVAEYVAGALVLFPRRMMEAERAVRKGDWGFRNQTHGPELQGRTLGIVGFGRIGRRIAEICGLGFGMRILYSDAFPAPPEEEARLSAERVELEALLASADFITLNVPLLDSTYHLINETTLNKMQPHAVLINCSRGPVIDEAALVEALQTNKIAGAIIDVYEEEPVDPSNPLLTLDNILVTPHCSGHSLESAQNMSMVAADIIRVLQGQKPECPVNDPQNPRQPLSG